MLKSWACSQFVVVFGLLSAAPWISAQQAISFRIGATVGRDGSCASLYNDTVLGYKFFFNWLAQRPPMVVTDASGKSYRLRMQLRLISHNCSEEGRADAMTSLINGTMADPLSGNPAEPPVHLLLGGHGDNAMEDAIQADAASRLLLHCCTARDTVFRQGLRHVYGLFTPASLYTGTVLRTMALRGMRRVAVVYTRESLLHVQLCEGALAQLPLLGELRPGFGAVLTVNYSEAEARSTGFWDTTSARVAGAGADVLIACDAISHTSRLVHKLRVLGHKLSALWLASWGNVADFLDYLDGRGEYALTTVQWMPNLPYADSDFGTAAQYAVAFTAATGLKPSYFGAAATASGYVLLKALQKAISMCSLDNVTQGGVAAADAFMWNEGALSCVDAVNSALDITGRSGTAILNYVLSILNMDTFFGPVGFNGYRQNIYHPVIVTQVLDHDLAAVLPLDVADKPLVMPIPDDDLPQHDKAWVASPTGISILTLLLCLGVVCAALGLLMCRRRVSSHLNTQSVEIRWEDIQVDISPQANPDGSFEPGEGVYRGNRVKLVVMNDPSRNLRASKPDMQSSLSTVNLDVRESSGQRPLAPPPRSFPSAKADAVSANGDGAAAAEDTSMRPSILVKAGMLDLGMSNGSGLRKQHHPPPPPPPQQQSQWLQSPRPSDGNLMLGTSPGRSGPVNSAIVMSVRPQVVAMYGLSQRARRQLLSLVWRAVRLQHPRMCPVLGIVWEWPGLVNGGGRVPVLVRQWHEFDSLDRLLENETVPLPLRTKATIAQGVAEGLAYLHAQEPPIVAGPLEASRIIMDKHFNPHLFLRLRNLHPEYGSCAAAAATAAADGCHVSKLCGMSAFCKRPSAPQKQLVQHGAAPSRLAEAEAAEASLPPPPLRKATAAASVEPSLTAAVTTVLPFFFSTPGDGNTSHHRPPQSESINDSGLSQPPPHRLTGVSVLSDVDQQVLSAARPAGLFAPPPYYQPSKEQDVYEFGLLLCRIFIVASPEDSGRLRFANVASAAIASTAAEATDVSVAGGNSFFPANLTAAARPPDVVVQTVDPDQLESVLGELHDICPELGDLARSCIQPNSRLSFPAIAKALEQVVIPALTGSDGVPRGLRRNPLSAKVYGSIGVGGGGGVGGGSLALRDQQDLVLRSVSSVVVVRSGPSQIMCRRSSVSVTRAEPLRGVRANHHHAVAPDDLLFDIFPPKVARALQAGETVQPERYECVSIFFSDVVGYTDLCGQLQPGEVMDLVHRLYSRFDDFIREMHLFKVETVGDAYLAVGNLRWPQPDNHARLMAQFAFAAVTAANSLPVHPDRPELGTVHVRVGLHCGPVVGSVVGTLNRRYCLFGDAVNTAARMEHNSEADRINCSAAFAALLREQWPDGVNVVSRGVRQVKGKGPMETFWVEEAQPAAEDTIALLDDAAAARVLGSSTKTEEPV